MEKTITIKYKDEPGPGFKSWSLKDEAGARYYASQKIADVLRVGQTVSLVVEEGVGKTGKVYYTIKGLSMNQQQLAAPPTPPGPSHPVGSPNLSKEAGMFAMAVVGKVYQGTGKCPDRAVLASQALEAMLAWDDAVQGYIDVTTGADRPLSSPEIPFDDFR